METDPLLEKIAMLRARQVMASGAEADRVGRELRETETQLTDREMERYLAGEGVRAVAQPEGPLTSAEMMAAVFAFAARIGVELVPMPTTKPLSPVEEYPEPKTAPMAGPRHFTHTPEAR